MNKIDKNKVKKITPPSNNDIKNCTGPWIINIIIEKIKIIFVVSPILNFGKIIRYAIKKRKASMIAITSEKVE